MKTIKQGFLMTTVVFITSLLFFYLIYGDINWIIASGVAGGSLFGNIVFYLWQRDAEKQ
ncbi:MAG: hypothetical protein K0A90_05905 [Methanosarcinaceae archaeon]|nr:hypothetical protein [Methanosarcinaceae archaeon]